MDARERLHQQNRFEETLPSGLTITIRLPRIRDCIIAGQVPLPILEHVQQLATSPNGSSDIALEDAAHMARFQDELVRQSVVEIEGQPIEMTLDDVGEFSQKDYDRIVLLAMRQEVSPKVESPT